MNDSPNLYALVMAGGSGTRFWPASRARRPKQLLPIVPGSDKTLIAETVERIASICPPDRVLVVTGEQLLDATRAALPELPEAAFLGEPFPRNTAACIGWGSAHIARSAPDAVIMALPSDHHVADPARFLEAVRVAVESARSGTITTIGIVPTRPDTGYGYIEAAETVGEGARRVERFVEKPDRERAEQYVASGKHYWNSGMFFFRAQDMLDAIAEHLPDLDRGLERIDRAARLGSPAEVAEIKTVFESLASVSIDYGVMEKLSGLHVVPASFGWSDLGSWQVTHELADKDEAGNAVDSDVLLIEAQGNLVRDLRSDGDGRVIAVVGVRDLCIIETDDALLVIPRERSQDVRQVVELLRKRGDTEKL